MAVVRRWGRGRNKRKPAKRSHLHWLLISPRWSICFHAQNQYKVLSLFPVFLPFPFFVLLLIEMGKIFSSYVGGRNLKKPTVLCSLFLHSGNRRWGGVVSDLVNVLAEQLRKSIFYFAGCLWTTVVLNLSHQVIALLPFIALCNFPGVKGEDCFGALWMFTFIRFSMNLKGV